MITNFSHFSRNLSKIVITSCTNPKINLSHELSLLQENNNKFDHILYIWRNKPCVVIGKHQNPYKECNIDFMRKNGITLTRRSTGGGAVYQDLGNTNWTFISTKQSTESNNQILVDSLKKFGIDAEISGRNDIIYKGRKISGAAFYNTATKSMHHGTMLIDVNLTNLVSSLTVDKSKLIAKGVDSIRSRVMNIREEFPVVTHESFSKELIDTYTKAFGDCRIVKTSSLYMFKNTSVLRNYLRMKSNDWIYGKFSSAQVKATQKFDFGLFDLNVDVYRGKTKNIHISSDSLNNELVEALNQSLEKTVRISSKEPLNEFVNNANENEREASSLLSQWVSKEISNYI